MSDFIDQLDRELRAATRRRVRLEAARIPAPAAGTLAAAVSLAACVAVIMVATHLHPKHPVQPAAHHTSPEAVDPRIVANFSAFRRPRTRSDRLPPGLKFGLCGGEGPGNYSACNNGDLHAGRLVRNGRLGFKIENYRTPVADAADGWRLVIYGQAHHLQVGRSRRLALPDDLGSIWLIPSGHWLCAYLGGHMWTRYWVRMECGTIGLILRKPPIDFPGFFFGPTAHGILIAAEPDTVTSATVAYPGGTETATLHDGALTACVGQGPYELEQRTGTGRIKPINVGAVGAFKPASCPALHTTNH